MKAKPTIACEKLYSFSDKSTFQGFLSLEELNV